MAVDLTRALLLIVGLGPGVAVTEVRGHGGGPLVVGVELAGRPCCGGCGGKVHRHGAAKVSLADLPAFGRPVRLVWNKRRWLCPDGACAVRTFTDQDSAVALPRARMTSRAARHATRRAGLGRAIKEIAAELGTGWHTVMRAVHRWGRALLGADPGRTDGRAAGSRMVTLTASLPCAEHLGALATGRVQRTGAVKADSACITAHRGRSGSYYTGRHTFTLGSPGWVTVDIGNDPSNSSRLDTYLILLKGTGAAATVIGRDDDSGPRTDSRLADVFLQRGSYTIEATTYRSRTQGSYRLSIDATVTGLIAEYNAFAGRKLVVEFETGPFIPTASVSASSLSVKATRVGSAARLAVTPSRTGSFSVKLSFGRPTRAEGSGSARVPPRQSTRGGSADVQDVGVHVICPDGQVDHPSRNGTCVLSESELRKVLGRQGCYHVTPALLDGTRRVAQQSLDAYQGECGMRSGHLAAVMMAIGFWETPVTAKETEYLLNSDGKRVDSEGNPLDEQGYPLDRYGNRLPGEVQRGPVVLYKPGHVKRSPARSLMTLSRGDFHQFGAKGKNAVLYPDNLPDPEAETGDPARAFWHPGVGYWQLDLWESTKGMNHAERADVDKGGREVADVLRDAYCGGGEAGLKAELNEEWEACVEVVTDDNEASNVCYETAAKLYLGLVTGTGNEAFYVTTAHNSVHDSTTGGARSMKKGCRWGSAGTPFDCWFYDTDSYQGHAETGRENGDRNPPLPISPYAAPFMSFTHGGYKYAVFPESFTGGDITRMKFVPKSELVRTNQTDNTWRTDTFNGGLQVRSCPSSTLPYTCTWTDASDSRFKSRIRAAYPDANPSKNP